jgi:hypothetical protein
MKILSNADFIVIASISVIAVTVPAYILLYCLMS